MRSIAGFAREQTWNFHGKSSLLKAFGGNVALSEWNLAELRLFGQALRESGDKILQTCEKMELAKLEKLVLQASAALLTYGPAIFRLAGTIDAQFVDQYTAAKQGRMPRWEQNQKKVRARAERKRQLEKSTGSPKAKAARRKT